MSVFPPFRQRSVHPLSFRRNKSGPSASNLKRPHEPRRPGQPLQAQAEKSVTQVLEALTELGMVRQDESGQYRIRDGKKIYPPETIIFGSNGDETFVADVLELPRCKAHRSSQRGALGNVQKAIKLRIDPGRNSATRLQSQRADG